MSLRTSSRQYAIRKGRCQREGNCTGTQDQCGCKVEFEAEAAGRMPGKWLEGDDCAAELHGMAEFGSRAGTV